MKKYVQNYLNFITEILNSLDKIKDIKSLKKELLIQIQFIQHERFIHLIVMCLFAIVLFISIGIFLITDKIALIPLIMLLLCLLIPYIAHYYFLENSVQKLYDIYNQICLFENDYTKETGKI